MRKRDKLHTMKQEGAEIQTLLNGRYVRLRAKGQGLGFVYVWLTPHKLRRLAKRLLWCADTIEGKR